jgi:hypothetical protein
MVSPYVPRNALTVTLPALTLVPTAHSLERRAREKEIGKERRRTGATNAVRCVALMLAIVSFRAVETAVGFVR